MQNKSREDNPRSAELIVPVTREMLEMKGTRMLSVSMS